MMNGGWIRMAEKQADELYEDEISRWRMMMTQKNQYQNGN